MLRYKSQVVSVTDDGLALHQFMSAVIKILGFYLQTFRAAILRRRFASSFNDLGSRNEGKEVIVLYLFEF